MKIPCCLCFARRKYRSQSIETDTKNIDVCNNSMNFDEDSSFDSSTINSCSLSKLSIYKFQIKERSCYSPVKSFNTLSNFNDTRFPSSESINDQITVYKSKNFHPIEYTSFENYRKIKNFIYPLENDKIFNSRSDSIDVIQYNTAYNQFVTNNANNYNDGETTLLSADFITCCSTVDKTPSLHSFNSLVSTHFNQKLELELTPKFIKHYFDRVTDYDVELVGLNNAQYKNKVYWYYNLHVKDSLRVTKDFIDNVTKSKKLNASQFVQSDLFLAEMSLNWMKSYSLINRHLDDKIFQDFQVFMKISQRFFNIDKICIRCYSLFCFDPLDLLKATTWIIDHFHT